MKLRIARKIRKKWKLAFDIEQKVDSYRWQKENGPHLREVLLRITGTTAEPTEPKVSVTRAEMRLLRGGSHPRHDRQQVTRAYLRLRGEERTDWAVDMAILRAKRRTEKMSPWEQAKEMMDAWPTLLARIVEHVTPDAPVAEAAP